MNTKADNYCVFCIQGGKQIPAGTWIHIIDSGGQPEFHDLLPLFVPYTSVVIFVFKLSEGLDHKPVIEYYGQNGPIGDKYESYLTHEEILEHSLKVFRANKGHQPTILVIGTYKDQPQLLNIENLKKCFKHVSQNVVHFGTEPIILINCLSQDKNDIQRTIDSIRKSVLTEANSIIPKPTPLAWFGLEITLKIASQDSKPKGILYYRPVYAKSQHISIFQKQGG